MAADDQASIWKKVSNNHALDALSLARSVTKEEKEKENTRKVAPSMYHGANVAPAGRPSSVRPPGQASDELKADTDRAIARARKDFLIRHHLDRTTGDGALLPSPTREKLEPVIPRRHEDDGQPRSKPSPKSSPRSARSQSVGPSVDRKSPKRHQPRPPSAPKEIKEKEQKEQERHPRPTSGDPSQQVNGHAYHHHHYHPPQPWIDDEPVVKSPPEPTRVKSPEQMIMRSPEPVNWTVPLDTGKTFTVTQNVREGEPLTRPHSEAKTWGTSSTPQPESSAQLKPYLQSQHSGCKTPESESMSLGSFSGTNGHKDHEHSETASPLAAKPKAETEAPSSQTEASLQPMAATSLHCLEDPVFEFEPNPSGGTASDVLEKARNRFDKFWGKGPDN